MNYFKGILLFLFVGLLFSCSGDDNNVEPDSKEPEEPTVVTGIFVDSEVTGLGYSTETQSGVTNSQGEYNYIEGETVTFSIGEIVLGSAPAGPEMTPVSIASTADATVETQEVKNIAALLQTLDSDNDPSNGILIETATVEAIEVTDIDFTQSIISVLGEIVAQVNLANDTNLSVVYPETAADHLASTMGEAYEVDDPVFNIFIPYMEDRYGQPLNSYYWVHETDDEGQLVRSFNYEKYPHRLAYEIVYTDYNEVGQPVRLEEILYDRATNEKVSTMTTEISYAEDGIPESSISTSSDYGGQGDYFMQRWYTKFDDEMRVVEFTFTRTPNTEPITRIVKVYDEEGNKTEQLAYDLGTGAKTNWLVYTYTEWGDKASEAKLNNTTGEEIARFDYFYREDRTLEKQTYSSFGNTGTNYFDENEIPISG